MNQVSDNIDESALSIENKARSAKPALGLFWRNLIDEAFLIEKLEDSKRTIEVTKSFRFADICQFLRHMPAGLIWCLDLKICQ